MSTTELSAALKQGPVLIHVKPNKRETTLTSTEPFTIEVAAPPTDGKANKELLSYLKGIAGPCRIRSGTGSRKKLVELIRSA